MFRIQATYKGNIEVNVGIEKARSFFSDSRNFVELMPGVDAIETRTDGTRAWTIRADVPMIGAMRQVFPVRLAEDKETLIEWIPATNEQGNLMRYSAKFAPIDANRTSITLEQQVEIRRENANELHTFAGWVGEARISKEMQRGVTAMMESFMKNTRAKLNG